MLVEKDVLSAVV